MKVSPQMRLARAFFEEPLCEYDTVDEKEDGFTYDRTIVKMLKAYDSSTQINDWKGMKWEAV